MEKSKKVDDIIVIGAGASGMMAAIMAMRAGVKVRILEKMKKPGRKLLLTGNGRCNMTNLDPLLPAKYCSVQSGSVADIFVEQVLSSFGVRDTLDFFESLGLLTQERDGYVYPGSGQAQSVLNALLSELERLGASLKYDTEVTGLAFDKASGLWLIETGSFAYQAKAVVLAGGSRAGIAEKDSQNKRDAFHLAKSLGHTGAYPLPALTAMHLTDPDVRLCEGARTRARVKLIDGGIIPYLISADRSDVAKSSKNTKSGALTFGLLPENRAEKDLASETGLVVGSEEGELQWTSSELSGIPVFQLSRFAYGCSPQHPLVLSVDFVPGRDERRIQTHLKELIDTYREGSSLSRILGGYVHSRVAAFLVKKSGYPEAGYSMEETDRISAVLASLLKRSAVIADRVRDYSQAQICIGGISLTEVDPSTLESCFLPGLFLAGELLDIDGPCGGYNLQWAWSSGAVAGRAAARKIGTVISLA